MDKEKRLSWRQSQALATKKKLYKSAISLFSQKNYNDVTIDEICKKCNVSKGAFYAHFSSKHDIIVEQSKNNDLAQFSFFESMPKDITNAERLVLFMRFVGENIFHDKGSETLRIIYAAELSNKNSPGYITDEKRPLYTCLQEIVETGQQSGEFCTHTPAKEISQMLISILRGALFDWLITSGQCNLPERLTALTQLALNGLRTNGTSDSER